jgi:tetratricopeptide (TPR) repeat protein
MTTPPKRQQRAIRSHHLRARGLSWEHIAAVWETDYPGVSPRIAYRWAHNLSHQEVADRWNALDAGDATMVKARIYQFENWPVQGRRPSVAALYALARVYQAMARALLTPAEYALYPQQERAEIDRIDYRHLDENHTLHKPIGAEASAYPGTAEVSHPSLSLTRDQRPLDPQEQLSLYARESSHILNRAEYSNVGSDTLERLHSQLRSAAYGYLKAPTGPLLAKVRRVRDEALRLLEGHQPLNNRRDLYLIAGWAMTFLAWASTDMGRVDATAEHAKAAWHFAQQAGHDGLRAWVCKTRQVVAYWANRREEAMQHAERGMLYAMRVGGETEVMLTSTLALDYARLGRVDEARVLLQTAHNLAPDGEENDYPGGPLSCAPERALSYWADAYLVLGEPAAALEMAGRSVSVSQASSTGDRNLGTERMTCLHVVRASIDLGELEVAEEALLPVLETPTEARPAPLLIQLSDIAARMQPALRNSRQGRRISDAIGAFQAVTVQQAGRQTLGR